MMDPERIKTFKLLVQKSESSAVILRYIDRNISKINGLYAAIDINKLPEVIESDMAESLNRQNISRLPALIAPDGKVFVGTKRIKELFDRNLRQYDVDTVGAPAASMSVDAFWRREMRSKDEEEEFGEGFDTRDYAREIQRRKARTPHYRGDDLDEDEPDPRPRRARRRPERRPDPRDEDDNITEDDSDDGFEPYDEYDDSPEQPRKSGGRNRGTIIDRQTQKKVEKLQPGGDDIDKDMMAAWLDNIPGGNPDF